MNVLFVIFGFIIRSVFVDKIITLREQGLGSLECSRGDICIGNISSGSKPCEHDICEAAFLDKIKEKCNYHTHCRLDPQLLDYCRRPPIFMEVNYTCWNSLDERNNENRRMHVCSDKLHKIRCNTNYNIDIYGLNLGNENPFERNCVIDHLKEICEEKSVCTAVNQTDTCLFEEKYVKIHYNCKDKSYSSTVTNILTLNPKTSTEHDIPNIDHVDITGTIAGSSIGAIIVVVGAIVALWVLRKRVTNKCSIKKRSTLSDQTSYRNEHSGSQDIRMPNATTQRAPEPFVYSVATQACRGVNAEKNRGDGYFVLEKENASDNSHAVTQKLSNKNVYSHATTNVYDHTSNPTRKLSEETVYSHSVDGIYDKTSDTSQVENSDNLYSHSVDDFYDKLLQNMKSQDAEDTYNHMFGATTEDN